MKSILAAIARVLRSLPRFVYERFLEAGQWVSRLVSVPAEPMPEPAGSPPAAIDDEDTQYTRVLAAQLLAGNIPSPEVSGRVSEERFEWLCALTPEMLKAVVGSTNEELKAHLRRNRNLRGVFIADIETVREYTRRIYQEDEETPTAAWKPAIAM